MLLAFESAATPESSFTLQLSPLFKVFIIECQVLTGDVLQQARNAHLTTSEFVDVIIKSIPYLATEEYRFAVFDDRDF